VRDDGVGGAQPGSDASGLIGLADRLGALSGTLDIVSPQSGGTVLRAVVPLGPGTALQQAVTPPSSPPMASG
jgi:signal transduction histidine kinase